MKSLRIFSIAALSLAIVTTASAQTTTETFKVSGNCGMCKTKIEKAAKDGGAKTAEWNSDTKDLTISYKASSTNTAKIQEKIAKVGYDNAGANATNEAYEKLHGCCKYERSESAKSSCCNDGATCKHENKDKHEAKADCCKDGKCTMAGHEGKDCCKEAKADCCKDGKCTKEGHTGKECCKKSDH